MYPDTIPITPIEHPFRIDSSQISFRSFDRLDRFDGLDGYDCYDRFDGLDRFVRLDR
jgi:hypothetical protein